MKKLYPLIFLTLFLVSGSLLAQQGRYLEEVFDDVQVEEGITYGVNATVLYYPVLGEAVPERLLCDVYQPEGDTETNRPMVIVFHTGNFLPIILNQGLTGTRTDSAVVEVCKRLARHGYVAVSADYRLGWNPTAETQPERALGLIQAAYRGIQDSRTAIRYFKRLAAEQGNPYGVDTSRIVLWGIGTGGYISLATATFDKFTEIATTTNPAGKFLTDLDGDPSTLEPMVIPFVNGDIYGTSVGINPTDGDTLCYPNHVGYNSDFQLCVNMGGALGDISWLEANSPPTISYQAPNDQFAPYEDAVLVVPTTNDPIVRVQGSLAVAEKSNALGNNQAFIDASISDVYTQAAMDASAAAGHDYFEGLFPFNRPINMFGQPEGSPWDWWEPSVWDTIPHPSGVGSYHQASLLTNASMSPEQGRTYIDSIFGYYAPRAFAALDLGTSALDLLDAAEVELSISPNPASDFIRIQTAADQPMEDVYVYDMSGKFITAKYGVRNNQVLLMRGNIPAGMYVLKLRFRDGIVAKQVLFE